MVPTHVKVARARVETRVLGKVRRKYTYISIVVSANCANYSDMVLALGKLAECTESRNWKPLHKSKNQERNEAIERERENELIPQLFQQLAVVCSPLLVQNCDQTPKAKPSPLGPGHPPATKTIYTIPCDC